MARANYLIYFCVSLFVSNVASSLRILQLVDRASWGGKDPIIAPEPMANPVPYVIIHHSYQPAACSTPLECIAAMQWMQNLHQVTNGWNDVGYNFAVGGDMRVYIGRGWSSVGAHAPSYNIMSIGICIIGDWRVELPPADQLAVVKELIETGVTSGMISANYTLYGHRQVREGTECPGDRLFQEISTWPHFSDIVTKKTVDKQ